MNYYDYEEKKKHGTPDFPLAYSRVDETNPNYEMPFHWHRELEISYILKGSYTFYLDDETIIAKKGDVVFIDQGVIHGGKPDNCVYDCLVFNPKPVFPNAAPWQKLIEKFTNPNIHIHSYFPADATICRDTKCLMDTFKTPSETMEMNALIQLYHWFLTIYETCSYTTVKQNSIPDASKMQLLKPVLEYIESNYMHPITLEELASLANLSVSHFGRYFKNLIHKTPIDYLLYYRVERSCFLLATTQLPLAEVAYQCGFNDISYFIHIFKKYKGITPKQYQRQYQ